MAKKKPPKYCGDVKTSNYPYSMLTHYIMIKYLRLINLDLSLSYFITNNKFIGTKKKMTRI